MISTYDFMVAMKRKVADHLNEYYRLNNLSCHVEWTDVFVVWQCKVIQNIKMILAAHGPDHILFEASYNGDKHETYLDVYHKHTHITIPDEEIEE